MRFDSIDPNLLKRCVAGDAAAFDALCVAIQQDLYGLLFAILRDHDDADDALQECFVRLFRHLSQLDAHEKFPGWMTRMAVNQCKTLLARKRNRSFAEFDDQVEVPNDSVVAAAETPASPRRSLESKELGTRIHEAIGALPQRQRAAIVLYEIEKHPVAEIASLLGCSQGAVKFNLHEARKKLRTLLHEFMPTDHEVRS